MKKYITCVLVVLLLALPMAASAGVDLSSFEAFKAQAASKGKLHFPETSNAMWEKRSNDQLAFRCQLQNNGYAKTVAYELYIYTENIWEERMQEEAYRFTVRKALEPNQVGYTEYIVLPDQKEIDKVYVGIKRVKYDSGVIETFDNMKYYNWTIK
ncbi:MAG: hypothetical protein IKU38_06290 [Clostridia bacterium]|nr:hypothetical protein [Clostridia bacterium]